MRAAPLDLSEVAKPPSNPGFAQFHRPIYPQMRHTDQEALRVILLNQPAADFRVFLLPDRKPLTKHQALNLLDRGTYVYKTDKAATRVKWLQDIETAPEISTIPNRPKRFAWLKCYLTTEAPVLQPGMDWAK